MKDIKVKPRHSAAEDAARRREAARDYALEKDAALERVQRKHGLSTASGPSVYGPDSPFSFFRDLARDQVARQTVQGSGNRVLQVLDVLPPDPSGGSLPEARARLASLEVRDVTSADPGVASFLPTDAPNFVGEEFATALRARGVLPEIIRVRPLPEKGSKVDVPRVATGASAAVQATEAAVVAETDVDWDTVSANKVTIAGQLDFSLQAWSFMEGGDVAIAAELGAAVAAVLDQQIVNGSGSSGQMRGILNITGVTSVAKTNASPTGTSNYKALSDLVNQTAVAYGAMPDTLVLHPRRRAWIEGQLAFNPGWFSLRPAVVNAVPTTLGGGTEDRPIAIPASEIILFAGRPRLRVLAEVLGGNLQIRVQAIMFEALVAGRKPAAIGVLSGTEVAAPVF